MTRGLSKRLPLRWRVVLTAFLATRGVLVIFIWVLQHFTARDLRVGHFLYHGGATHPNWLINGLQKWDSYWFLNIVREGYQFFGATEQISAIPLGQAETNVTPFPLYPLLTRALDSVIGDPSLSGLLISNVCLIGAMVLLFRLVALDHTFQTATLSVWLFALVPWTYAFSGIYSESLFFFTAVAAVLAIRKDHYLLAGVLGMSSALTRLPGALVAVPLLWEHFSRYKWSLRVGGWRVVFVGLVPLGTLSYFIYLWHLTGAFDAYFIGQQGWHKELVPLWHHPLKWLFAPELDAETYLDIFSTAFMLGVLYLGFRKVRMSYWLYALAGFLMLLSSSNLLGFPRYTAGLFPVYVILAGIGSRLPTVGQVLTVSFAMAVPMVYWVWSSWEYAF